MATKPEKEALEALAKDLRELATGITNQALAVTDKVTQRRLLALSSTASVLETAALAIRGSDE